MGNYNRCVAPNTPITLLVDVTANDMDNLTYRWTGPNGTIANATTASLTLDSVNADNDGYYYCYVSDPYGNQEYTYYYLYVDNGFTVSRVGNYDQGVAPNTSLTLSVNATANDASMITYQWSGPNGNIQDATGSSFTISSVNADPRGSYYCYVYDGYGGSEKVNFYVYVENNLSVEVVGD